MSEDQQKIERVIIENVGGDLRLRGDEDNESFRIKADMPIIERDDATGTMRVKSAGDCNLQVPGNAAIEVENVGGDAKLTYFNQPISINHIAGDLILRHALGVTLTSVGGDLSSRYIEGDFEVQDVGSDMDIRQIEGDVTINNVGADLSVRQVEGSVKAHQVGGDILVDLEFESGHAYEFHAGGDIVVSLDPDMNVTFLLPPGANYEVDDLGEEYSVNVIKDDEHTKIEFGSNEEDRVTVEAHAGSTLYLSDKGKRRGRSFNFHFNFEPPEPPEPPVPPVPPAFGDFDIKVGNEPLGDYISRTVSEQMARVSENLGNLGKDWGELGNRIAERAERSAERAARRAERQAERAAKRAERFSEHDHRYREAERERRRAERMRERYSGQRRGVRDGESEPVPAVSDEERMMILNMLEEGKISVDEAEHLLSTMEGNEGEA